MPRNAHQTCVAALLLLILTACADEKTYDVQGRIAGFGDVRTLIVEHGDIPGLMPAMTMPFDVRGTGDLDTLHVGDAVAFVLHVRGDSTWIDHIRRLPDDALPEHPAGRPDALTTSAPALLEMGDPAPEVQLMTHADTTLSLAQLRGTPVVLTFIYTRCPLPDYCPRMVQNFVRLQQRIQEAGLGPVHLLSVSFDPAYDTPAALREYAARYDADLSSWTFATGDSSAITSMANQFGVYYRTQGGEIVHNLSTALIAPDGRIRRIWRGNDWTVDQVLTALRELEPA